MVTFQDIYFIIFPGPIKLGGWGKHVWWQEWTISSLRGLGLRTLDHHVKVTSKLPNFQLQYDTPPVICPHAHAQTLISIDFEHPSLPCSNHSASLPSSFKWTGTLCHPFLICPYSLVCPLTNIVCTTPTNHKLSYFLHIYSNRNMTSTIHIKI